VDGGYSFCISTCIKNKWLYKMMETILFFIFRLIAVILGLYIGYRIVQKFIEPNVLDQICLTNTENCSKMDAYLWQNTIVAKEEISQIWFWYNGDKLYVYGQAAGTCPDQTGISYSPVSTFSVTRDNTGQVNFGQLPNECIPNIQNIIDLYRNEKKAEKTDLFLSRDDPNKVNSIFSIIKNLLDNNIIVL
jgi:hypothetical protein